MRHRWHLSAIDGESMPRDPHTRLTRQKLAEALTDDGFPTKPSTLATKATRGGGPPYELWGKKPIYTWGTSLAWAKSRLSAPRTNSSEHCLVDADRSKCAVQRIAGGVEDAATMPAMNPKPTEANSARPLGRRFRRRDRAVEAGGGHE
jgi:hypothetical protein